MNNVIRILDTGLVYSNPYIQDDRIHVQQPSVMMLDNHEFVTTYILDHIDRKHDARVVVSRSNDMGRNWNLEGNVLKKTPPMTSHSMPCSKLSDGSLIGVIQMNLYDHENSLTVNVKNWGRVPCDLNIVRSFDGGRLWTNPLQIEPPLIGPSWEVCHHVLELASGRFLLPIATWRGWNGESPNGEKTVVFISDDRGNTWPRYGVIFDGKENGFTHWEKSVIQLDDGRLLAVSWVYDSFTSETHPSVYAISEDDGETFSDSLETGFLAQTCKVIQLKDGKILSVYRRHDEPGLWATLVEIRGNQWVNLSSAPIWQGAESGMSGERFGSEELGDLKFGYPSFVQLLDGDVLLLFWCSEEMATHIRWTRLQINV